MSENLTLREEDLIVNPTARVPLCLCLDTSGSMGGDSSDESPIAELNDGVKQFFEELRSDAVARYSAEIAVVTFGGVVRKVLDFDSLERQAVPCLEADGNTPMAGAVNLALDLLEARKKEYSAAGIDYYQPWLVLMTDGAPTDSPGEIEEAVSRTTKLVKDRKLTLFPIGVGAKANLDTLGRFSPTRTPLRLKGVAFKPFFEWLSKSVGTVSKSIPGQHVPLDEKGIKGWAELLV